MKPWAWVAITVLAALAVYMADRNGYNRAIGETNAEAARIAQDALDEQNRLQSALNDMAGAYHQSMTQEQVKHERLKNDFKNQPRLQDCSASRTGAVTATLSPGTLGMLEQSRASEALPEASAGQGPAGKENTPPAL